MERIATVPNILHLSSTAGATALSQLSHYASLLMPTMLHFSWRKISSLDVTVVFLMYMDKLVYRNSDINQEAIREK